MMKHAFEDEPPVGAAKKRFAGAFWMGHQPGHIALLIADPGDVFQGPIGIGGVGGCALGIDIFPEDLATIPKLGERFGVSEIAPLPVRDGDAEEFAGWDLVGKRRVRRETLQKHMFAAELERAIADERPGEQTGLAQHLKSVADAQHQTAFGGEPLHCPHHGTKARDRSAAEIIAVTEPTRNNDGISIAQLFFLVPNQTGALAGEPEGVESILIAIGGGELKNNEVHGCLIVRVKIVVVRFRCLLPHPALLNFQAVILDHRVAQEFVARLIELFAGILPIAPGEFDFQVFAHVDGADALIAHMGEGVLDGFALGIQHGLLWSNDDFGFHSGSGRMLGKGRSGG